MFSYSVDQESDRQGRSRQTRGDGVYLDLLLNKVNDTLITLDWWRGRSPISIGGEEETACRKSFHCPNPVVLRAALLSNLGDVTRSRVTSFFKFSQDMVS